MSATVHRVGDRLCGTGNDKLDARIENALEKRKPQEALSRRDALFCRSTSDFSRCGIVDAGYIYRVEPEGTPTSYDLSWIGEMQKALVKEKHLEAHPESLKHYPDWNDELIYRCCTAYWNRDASKNPVWEFLISCFVVKEALSNRMITALETKGGML